MSPAATEPSTSNPAIEPKVELNIAPPGSAVNGRNTDSFTVSAEDTALLDSYFGSQIRMSMVKLYERIIQQPFAKSASFGSVTSEPITDRELRKKMHQVTNSNLSTLNASANTKLKGCASDL